MVTRATLTIVRWPLAATGAAGRGAWPQRTAAILTLADGAAVGFGEAAPLPGFGPGGDTVERAGAAIVRWIETGDDAAAAGPSGAGASPSAIFAIETARDGLAAARAGRSLAAHWAAPVPPRAIATAAVVADAAEARAAIAAGHVALKVKLDGDGDRARLVAIRAAAPATAIRGDANGAWPLAEVDARLADLADLGLEYVEEPAAGLGPRLDRRHAVPLALDESLADPARERWLPGALASGAVAAVVLKPTVLGGVAACRALARRAAAFGVEPVWSHALEGPIGFAAVTALARAAASRRAAGLAPHPGLAAWGAIASHDLGLGLEPIALRAAIAAHALP